MTPDPKPLTATRRRERRPAPAQRPPPESYHVLVECADEREQRALFERLVAEGKKCRVLTM